MHKAVLGAILASVVATGTAQAAITSNAEINGLKLTLVDLDLNDGITPSVTWIDSFDFNNSSTVDLAIGDSNADWTFREQAIGYDVNGTISHERTILHGTSGGSINGDGNNFHMLSSATFFGQDGVWNKVGNKTHTGYIPFVLSPNTKLTLSADVLLNTSSANLPFLLSAERSASATLYVDGAWAGQAQLNSLQGGAGSLTKTLSYTLSNATGADANHRFFIGLATGVSANFSIVAVPEPSTWGMLMLGVATVGAIARRRRSSLSQ